VRLCLVTETYLYAIVPPGLNDLWAFDDSIIENYTILKNGGFTYRELCNLCLIICD